MDRSVFLISGTMVVIIPEQDRYETERVGINHNNRTDHQATTNRRELYRAPSIMRQDVPA